MKKWSGLLMLIIVVLILPACGTQSAPATPKSAATSTQATNPQYGGTLKIIIRGAISTLGAPSEVSGASYGLHAAPALQSLIRMDKDFNPEVRKSTLAEYFNIAPDGKSITFHLRKGIKFQDGTPFNAEAVKYNIDQVYKVGTTFQNVSSYDVIDENTIRFNLKEFDAALMPAFSRSSVGMLVSPTAMKIPSTPEKMAQDHMVGTGPFKFVNIQRDVSLKYAKFEGYWQTGKPYLDSIEFIPITDPVTAMLAFQKGDGQVLDAITPREARELEAKGFNIIVQNLMRPITAIFTDGANQDSPFSDKRVRQAAEYAIDKKALATALGSGYYDAATQFASPQDERYVTGLTPRDYDPGKAKQLLAEAGYPNGFNTSLIAQNTTDNDLLVAVQNNLKQVGINATLDIADRARFSTIMTKGFKNGLVIHSGPVGMNLTGIKGYLGPPGASTMNYVSAYRPPGWLDKINTAMSEPNDSKRLAQTKELIKIIYDESLAIPLFLSGWYTAEAKNVHDLDWGNGNNTYFEPGDAWLSK